MEARDRALERQLAECLTVPAPKVYAFTCVSSTMDIAHRLAGDGATEGTCVWAETQTGGRGRAGRSWASPPGGIYLSLIVRPSREIRDIPQLALVAGLAVAQTIHEVAGLSPSIRWPNDVLVNGQKVAGILVEASSAISNQQSAVSKKSYAVVGMGINVTTAPANLPEGAVSLAQRVSPPDRFVLTGALVRHFDDAYHRWNTAGFAPIRTELARWMGLFGQLVHITTAKEAFQGQAADLDEAGRLLVRLDVGVLRPVEMGEVTLLR